MPMRTYDMDTDLPGPVEELGGFVTMVGAHEFQLMRSTEMTTSYRCSNAPKSPRPRGETPWKSRQVGTARSNSGHSTAPGHAIPRNSPTPFHRRQT